MGKQAGRSGARRRRSTEGINFRIIWAPSLEIRASRATGDVAGCTQGLIRERVAKIK